MVVPPEVLKCVIFVGFRMADSSYRVSGTAFLLSRPVSVVPNGLFIYAVTARHVIEGIQGQGLTEVWLRINIREGQAKWIHTAVKQWILDRDPRSDVAVLQFRYEEQFDHKTVPLDMSVTDELIAKHEIGPGDEVFLTGLFVHHYGARNNIPIVRIGNIASMPQEPVATGIGDIRAYLIEARSIGGLSGSPVFVQMATMRHGSISIGGPQFFLLGLMHGHFEGERKGDVLQSHERETVNMGIGIVVPMDTVLKTLDDSRIRTSEEATLRNFGQEHCSGS